MRLSEDQARRILDRLNAGETPEEIQCDYPVKRAAISHILHNKNWTSIDRADYPNLATPEKIRSIRNWFRFMSKIYWSDSGCWLWTAFCNEDGYGIFHSRVGILAHRYSYSELVSEIAPRIQLDHTCNSRACVNPHHLRPVTNKQNQENLRSTRVDNASGYRGVTWHVGHKKWHAKVGHNYKRVHVGYFDTAEEANAAAVAKRLELYTHNDLDRKSP